jgi:hypothetical protein
MRNITDVYLNFFHRHWLYNHDVSEADFFRLQVNYNLKIRDKLKQQKICEFLCDRQYNPNLYDKIVYKKLSLQILIKWNEFSLTKN